MAGHLSHGRGGAGNIAPRTPGVNPGLNPVDLETPTIKSSTYTTGRGGTGNMQPNVHPDITRQTQDVEAPTRAGRKLETGFQYGRGGAGNTVTLSKEEIVDVRSRSRSRAPDTQDHAGKGKSRDEKDEKPKKEQNNVVGKGVHMLQRVMSKGP